MTKFKDADRPRLHPGDLVLLTDASGRTDLIGQTGIIKSPLTEVTLTDQGNRVCLMYRIQFDDELLWGDWDAVISISPHHLPEYNAAG